MKSHAWLTSASDLENNGNRWGKGDCLRNHGLSIVRTCANKSFHGTRPHNYKLERAAIVDNANTVILVPITEPGWHKCSDIHAFFFFVALPLAHYINKRKIVLRLLFLSIVKSGRESIVEQRRPRNTGLAAPLPSTARLLVAMRLNSSAWESDG